MTDERTRKVEAALDEIDADVAVLTSQPAVTYALQFLASVEAGPSPWDGGPAVGVVGRDGTRGLVCHELEVGLADASGAEAVVAYESLGFTDHRSQAEKYAAAVSELFEQVDLGGTVAVERSVLPAAVEAALEERGARLVHVDEALTRARNIKTDAEVAALRTCAEATAAGHEVIRTAGLEGRTELDVFSEVRLAMESVAGERCAVTGDLVTGRARTAAVGGWPIDRVVQRGDPVIADLAPRVAGYWGDSCTTTVVGEASPELRDLYALVRTAWDVVLETLRPGQTCHAFDARVRRVITDAGYDSPIHHMGHNIGTAVHEWPRIIPGEHAQLEAGMVVLVEPGAYHPDVGGVRLEQMFLLTEDGHEVLSPWEVPTELPVVA